MAASSTFIVTSMFFVAAIAGSQGTCMDGSCVEGEPLPDAIHLMQARLDAFQNLASSKVEATKRAALEATRSALSLFQQHFAEAGVVNMGATAGVDKLSRDLGQLAASVVKGTTVLDSITIAALDEIWQSMEAVFEAAQDGHAEDQDEVLLAKEAIENCSAHTDGFGHYQDLAEAAEINHSLCRSAEGPLNDSKIEHCGNLESHVTTPGAPACMAGFSNLVEYNSILNCVGLIAAWASVYHADLIEDKELCDSATSDHDNKKILCDDFQEEVEASFCTYRRVVIEKCGHQGEYGVCRNNAINVRNEKHGLIKESESSRQAEFAAAKHIQCFLLLLNMTSADDQQDQLVHCKGLQVNVTHLVINYPQIPLGVPCDVEPVSVHPCMAQWVEDTYESQLWFEKAHTKPCTACED